MPPHRFSLLAAVASLSAALLVSPPRVATPLARSRVPQLSADDEFPSDDYSGEAAPVPEAATAAAAPVSAEVSSSRRISEETKCVRHMLGAHVQYLVMDAYLACSACSTSCW